MAHGQNILHALHSWLIHHDAWSKHFACRAFMAHPSWHVVKTFCMPFVHGSGDGCPATYFHDKNTAAMLSSTAK